MSALGTFLGHAEAVVTRPLLGKERKSLPTFKKTVFDPEPTLAAKDILLDSL